MYYKTLWDRADTDHSGSLDINEVVKLLTSANISLPFATIKKLYKQFDTDRSCLLDFQEFIDLMNRIRKRFFV